MVSGLRCRTMFNRACLYDRYAECYRKKIIFRPLAENKVRLSEEIIRWTAKVSQSTRRPTRNFYISILLLTYSMNIEPLVWGSKRGGWKGEKKTGVFHCFGKVIRLVFGDLYHSPTACPMCLYIIYTSTVTEITHFPSFACIQCTQFCGNSYFRKVACFQLEIARVENDTYSSPAACRCVRVHSVFTEF